ncbi:MAG: Flagellin B2 [Candidatus Argoarchaeum ethanivorans]|uniref:Flagellin n=1 Tax=Candidatus Argoarchaeum ethanivorans TaxID=2608793 RepID=A0A811TEJ1_9EURY|nr:MAG: Flagellin B2 [Candidatus Argoarchaeum ethanivorans]
MKKTKTLFRNEDGAVGIGTLIIFIAMVLVAAVAAGVLISTSGTLQQKAQTTGTETIAEISSNLMVDTIVGEKSSSTALNFTHINITISPNAGSAKIDLSQMIIKVSNGTRMVDNLVYNTTTDGIADNETFIVTELRDEDGSFTEATPVINTGDLVYITLKVDPLADANDSICIDFPARRPFHLELIPEFGATAIIDTTTPSTYGVDTIISLYP